MVRLPVSGGAPFAFTPLDMSDAIRHDMCMTTNHHLIAKQHLNLVAEMMSDTATEADARRFLSAFPDSTTIGQLGDMDDDEFYAAAVAAELERVDVV